MEILVAKSYQNLTKVGEVFTSSGKNYINVQTKSGSIKQVRVYSESEYAKMYPNEKEEESKLSQRQLLGFGERGYIFIFSGVTTDNEDWFENHPYCRYTRWWGWYVPACYSVPIDHPKEVKVFRLDWQLVGGEGERLKKESEVIEAVRKLKLAVLLQKSGESSRQEKIGERLELIVEVIGKQTEENAKYNSETYFYEFKDQKGNFYKWKTQAKDWTVGTKHHIRGTVKEFDEVNGEEAIVLTRCMEV